MKEILQRLTKGENITSVGVDFDIDNETLIRMALAIVLAAFLIILMQKYI
jgi:hypothetical protein